MMAKAGKEIDPKIHWYCDESYFDRSYDLVMINGALQYVREWKRFLEKIAVITKGHLFLTRVPVVEHSDNFVAIQKVTDAVMFHQQFNEGKLLETLHSAGFQLLREFVVGDRPFVCCAPEQPESRGWLFKK